MGVVPVPLALTWHGPFSPNSATSDEHQGAILGANQSMSALARGTAPAVGGLLFEQAYRAPLIVGAILLFGGVMLAGPATRFTDAPSTTSGT